MTIRHIREIDVHEAHRLADQGAVMLDVREDDEWRAGHLPGALHIKLDRVPTVTLETDALVVAVCRSGSRSGRAVAHLAGRGYDVVNMAGGMRAWQHAGLPILTDGGLPGTVL